MPMAALVHTLRDLYSDAYMLFAYLTEPMLMPMAALMHTF